MKSVKIVFLLAVLFIAGLLAAKIDPVYILAIIAALTALIALFIDFEKATLLVALYAVFEFVFRTVLKNPILSGYWDEMALLLCLAIWIYKWLRHRKKRPYRFTPLDIPILMFIGVGIIILFISPDFIIGIEGLRAVAQYMIWFFVITQLVKTPEGAKKVLFVFVLVGFLISTYAIYQYIIAVEIPSGWTDEGEGNVRTRVFSIFTTPNMLAGYLVLIIPVTIGMFFAEKGIKLKLYYGATAFIMAFALLFTLTRGGWIACFFALMIYIWMKKKKLIIPAFALIAVAGVLVAIFMPSVMNRITYLLSPEYIESSLRGGRLLRYFEGWELFKDHLWTGMGLGQFGGSVALNHKLNNTFSMDSYYLKTAVEMGIIGLFAFVLLMYNTLAWGYREAMKIKDLVQKDLVTGIVAGLFGVAFHNIYENIFEIPMMSAYFWMLAGIAMYLAYGQYQTERDTSSIVKKPSYTEKETL